jgi:hypothetical protein
MSRSAEFMSMDQHLAPRQMPEHSGTVARLWGGRAPPMSLVLTPRAVQASPGVTSALEVPFEPWISPPTLCVIGRCSTTMIHIAESRLSAKDAHSSLYGVALLSFAEGRFGEEDCDRLKCEGRRLVQLSRREKGRRRPGSSTVSGVIT